MNKSFQNQALQKIKDRSLRVGVIGLGYVGLPLLLSFAEAGFNAVGFDIDQIKIQKITQGQTYIKHIPDARINAANQSGKLSATREFSKASEMDALIICVPTPLNLYREPDLSFIVQTIESLLPHLKKGQLLSLESTTYPGTTEEELRTRVESRGFKVGDDFFLVFSPEREDPGNAKFHTRTIPKVVGGTTPACLEVGKALYASVIDQVVPVSSTQAAELTKLLENIYRSVNIGLVNEMKIVADKMGIDIWEVIDAAATKPFGFTPFYPGPGLGGHCIPIDPFYLTWKARQYGVHTRFIELAGEVNTAMPNYVVTKVMEALNSKGKALKNSKILVLGIAYKKNVDDMRESPSVELMEILSGKGAVISYADPFVPVFPKLRKHHFDLKSQEITAALLKSVDCVLLATDHEVFDYDLIQKNSDLIVDTRGRFRKPFANVIKS